MQYIAINCVTITNPLMLALAELGLMCYIKSLVIILLTQVIAIMCYITICIMIFVELLKQIHCCNGVSI